MSTALTKRPDRTESAADLATKKPTPSAKLDRTTFVGTEVVRRSTVQEWEAYGTLLKRVDEAKQWAIGDWLADGKRHYGDGLYEKAAAILAMEESTLRAYKSVAGIFAIAVRNSNLTHAHHHAVAALKKLETKNGKLALSDKPDHEKMKDTRRARKKPGRRSAGRNEEALVGSDTMIPETRDHASRTGYVAVGAFPDPKSTHVKTARVHTSPCGRSERFVRGRVMSTVALGGLSGGRNGASANSSLSRRHGLVVDPARGRRPGPHGSAEKAPA